MKPRFDGAGRAEKPQKGKADEGKEGDHNHESLVDVLQRLETSETGWLDALNALIK